MSTVDDSILRDLQLCELDILKELDRVCKKHSIEYCLAFGTCLGAIRHDGFIPWDDDIDVVMMPKEYEKLCAVKDEFLEPYFLQNSATDKEYGLFIGRLRNSNTTLIDKDEMNRDINHGIWIDIFPMYYLSSISFKRKMQIVHSMLYRLYLYGEPSRNHSSYINTLSKVFLRLPNNIKKVLKDWHKKNFTKYKNTDYCGILYGKESVFFKITDIFPASSHVFEGYEFPVPNNAHAFLSTHYGSDYMTPPPEEERYIHVKRDTGDFVDHQFVKIDLVNSFKKYKGIYYCVSKQGEK